MAEKKKRVESLATKQTRAFRAVAAAVERLKNHNAAAKRRTSRDEARFNELAAIVEQTRAAYKELTGQVAPL